MQVYKVLNFGDDINTDDIIAGKYLRAESTQVWADHLFENFGPEIRRQLTSETIIVAGKDFGCGSSREQAVLGLKEVGIGIIFARSFGSIFFRNCINNGIAAITSKEICDLNLENGEEVRFDVVEKKLVVLRSAMEIFWTMPDIHYSLYKIGGLLAYYKKSVSSS